MPQPQPQAKRSGFQRAGHQTKHRLIMASKSMQKSGKTHFALTMPAPIGIIALEPGLEGVIEKFQDKKEIYWASYVDEVEEIRRAVAEMHKKNGHDTDKMHDRNMELARDVLNRVKDDYFEALAGSRSVVMDTGTELWRLIRLANLGRIEQVKGRYYGQSNQEMLSFLRSAYSSDANVLLTHRMKKEYGKDDKPTGNLEIAGFNEIEFEVQVVVLQWKQTEEPVPDRFHSEITDCRLDPMVEGQPFAGETNTFPFVAATVFGTGLEEWQ